MKWLALLGAFGYFAAVSTAPAQIQVSAQTTRTNFLLYERVDLLVTIQNLSGGDLPLENSDGHTWLSFLVSKHNRLPVHPERQSEFAAITLKAGETKTLRVNLTPLFSFREEGEYKAAAVVDVPGQGEMISDAVPFVVMKGMKVWSQLRGVDDSQRVYSLIRFSPDADSTKLYLRVESPSQNVVYTNIALGDMASFMDPEVNFDPSGNLHVLQPVAMGTYLYSRADPDGKILNQTIFKTFHEIPPRLAKLDDGDVTVEGGQPEDADMQREKLSEGQSGLAKAPPVALPAAVPAVPPAALPVASGSQ